MSNIWFAKPAVQASKVMKALQGRTIKSVGTVRNYEQALTRVAEAVKRDRLAQDLKSLTPERAIEYLEKRGEQVRQKTLDMERQAIQAMMHHFSHLLPINERLPVVKSQNQQHLRYWSYTRKQVLMIVSHQKGNNALATSIVYESGLFAHELLSLIHASERPADHLPTQVRGARRYSLYSAG